MNITEEGKFSISISKLLGYDIPTYRLSIDIGVFRWIYDALYVVLSNNNIFSGYGSASGTFHISTLEMPNWNTLDLAIANSDEDVLFDLQRLDLHNYLYNVCLSFIIRHEIRHIANGHVGYLLDQNQPHFFEQSSMYTGKSYANLIDDCFSCKYFFSARGDDYNQHTHIGCLGNALAEIKNVIAKHKKS